MRQGENIAQVEALGVDMMGFIFWPKSKRHVERCPSYLPACQRVGVFVDASVDYIQQCVHEVGLQRLQLHGSESPAFCEEIHRLTGLPITKAISVRSEQDILSHTAYDSLPCVDLYLFDTKCTCRGGSGQQFDWDVLQHYKGGKPFFLAGGIGPSDVTRIRSFSHPRLAGIDLNSRFETAPALKDIHQLKTFITSL